MKFPDFYAGKAPAISFELFPPRTQEGLIKLETRIPKLLSLEPSFMTVTYGAMGSTRDCTLELVSKIRNEFDSDVAHHLTCVGSTADDITRLLESIRDENIENIVALRGDPPKGEAFHPPAGGYSHGNQLVEHIREFGGFGIAVAGYPEKHIEAADLDTDLRHLKQKVETGADVIITQLFYDNRVFWEFVRRCRSMGISQPIVPGLLPILNVAQIQRIVSMCGSTIPADLSRKLHEARDDPKRVHEIGIEHTVTQASELLERGVVGIHFYVLNQYFHMAEIMERIRPVLDSV